MEHVELTLYYTEKSQMTLNYITVTLQRQQ